MAAARLLDRKGAYVRLLDRQGKGFEELRQEPVSQDWDLRSGEHHTGDFADAEPRPLRMSYIRFPNLMALSMPLSSLSAAPSGAPFHCAKHAEGHGGVPGVPFTRRETDLDLILHVHHIPCRVKAP